jgi:primosomal protein N' (replication factor Y)
VSIVDMRLELKAGNRSIFSHALQESLQRVLENGQQAILFLNRRGMATYVFCRDCGRSLRCPHCDTPLTYHNPFAREGISKAGTPNLKTNQTRSRPRAALICHHCGYQRKMPKNCPSCEAPYPPIRYGDRASGGRRAGDVPASAAVGITKPPARKAPMT